ncbi:MULTISPECIES: hypothetical protein [Rhizobium]|uniref:hypothetical protein n=1 Tax=Rhizobium TaxID=379 RepID=UPI001440E611|nr:MULTISPECIES: hypothetical protein [Rhizobium]KAF5887950.1 hypothetical protein FY112_01415 [Rhizobium sp. PEPV16]
MEPSFQGSFGWILGVIVIAIIFILPTFLYIRNPAFFLVRISNLLHIEYKARNEEGPK